MVNFRLKGIHQFSNILEKPPRSRILPRAWPILIWRTDTLENNTRQIPLGNGQFTIVDEWDYEYLNRWKWHVNKNGYVQRTVKRWNSEKNPITVLMHRSINGTPRGLDTDHINGNKLDNRRSNLRSVTKKENSWNRHGLRKDNKSGFNGVHRAPHLIKHPWVARLGDKIIGSYSNPVDAAIAYNWACLKERGGMAVFNEIYPA